MGDGKEAKVIDILKKIDCNAMPINTIYIGKNGEGMGMVRVETKDFSTKINILKNKSKLKGEECYIDADLTRQERKIQQALRLRAKQEREKGKVAKVGYQKILIDDQWVNWRDIVPKNH